ncbi:MAG: nicotinate-nucleotide adenylyltransferase [Candidatus Dormibacteria bacterium]
MSAGTGVLGGTFDPFHAGHLAVARQCRELLGLEEVLLVPSFQPPHRPAPVAGPEDRLVMTRLGAAGVEGLTVDDLEVRRGGVSYAVETLRDLAQRRPGAKWVLLLGEDAAAEFSTWRAPDEIQRLARLVVFNRAGSPPPAGSAPHPGAAQRLVVDSPAVSATEVRRRLAAGLPVDGMVAPSVLDRIRSQRLYGVAD